MRICVYGGAQPDVDSLYLKEARRVGEEIADSGNDMIYGGGNRGCMGEAAKGCLSHGGHVMAIPVDYLEGIEPLFHEADTIITTKSLATRKLIMEEHDDAFIVLPGGVGTMDEMFQVVVQKELGQLPKQIVVLNVGGFYDSLDAMLRSFTDKGFIREEVRPVVKIATNAKDAVMLALQ